MTNYDPIPVFFAVDDAYAPCLAVAIRSLIDNASPDDHYAIHILVDFISEKHRQAICSMSTENISIGFTDVRSKLEAVHKRLHVRDYYSSATYYRFFIPALFPQYSKGIYLDCDIAILSSLSPLYNCTLGQNLVAAVPDEVVLNNAVFSAYTEKVLGISPQDYFNAGVLVMNLDEMRHVRIEKSLDDLMRLHTFRVAQDQDYLNVLCHGKTAYLDVRWNKTAFPGDDKLVTPHIAHYKLNFKPWHYEGVAYEEHFWRHAENTAYHQILLDQRTGYCETNKKKDKQQHAALIALAEAEIRQAVLTNGHLPVEYAIKRRRGA